MKDEVREDMMGELIWCCEEQQDMNTTDENTGLRQALNRTDGDTDSRQAMNMENEDEGLRQAMNRTDEREGLRKIRLIPEMLMDRESMARFMRENLELPAWFGGNLDALADVLSEVSEETVFEVEVSARETFDREGYPGKVLLVIRRAVQENPHLHLYLTDEDWMNRG